MQPITIETTVNAPIEIVWQYWNLPEHITQWAFASDDWHCPAAKNNLKAGGKFSTTMAAKDGSLSFDFGGVYDEVKTNELITYTLGDGRKVKTIFSSEDDDDATHIIQTFDPESENPVEMQKTGWQAILNNFKKYTEAN